VAGLLAAWLPHSFSIDSQAPARPVLCATNLLEIFLRGAPDWSNRRTRVSCGSLVVLLQFAAEKCSRAPAADVAVGFEPETDVDTPE
jgi:hypothetical protein